jgi:hypothetical protein
MDRLWSPEGLACRNLKIRGTVFTVSIVNSHIGESSKIISVSISMILSGYLIRNSLLD